MKTERKHELETNVLADWLGLHIQQYLPHLKNVAIGIGIGAVALVVYLVVNNQRSISAAGSWRDFLLASNERSDTERGAKFERVADLHPNDPSGLWAGLNWADIKLREGCDRLFSDRELARKDLEDARKRFEEIESASHGQRDLHQFAMYGLAQALEALGETKASVEKYRQIASASPTSAFGKAAKAKADFLANNSIEQFYDWFAKQTPRAPSPFGNRDLLPPDFGDLSDRPDKPSRPGLTAPPGFDNSLLEPDAGTKNPPEEPKPEEPKPEEPQSEAPKPEEPKAEPGKSDEPAKDAPKPEQP